MAGRSVPAGLFVTRDIFRNSRNLDGDETAGKCNEELIVPITSGEPPSSKGSQSKGSQEMDMEELKAIAVSRRSALKIGAAATLLLSEAAVLERTAITPARAATTATTFSDIQYDIGQFIKPAFIANDGAGNVQVQFGPVFTLLLPVKLTRTPTKADRAALANALNTIEASYPASPSGVFIASVSYGLPYFNRLPRSLVATHMPHLLSNPNRVHSRGA